MNATVNHDTHVAHIEAVVARQRTFFETGATRPVAVRVAALRRLKKEMQKREKILLDALQADLNKSHFEGYMCELGLNLDPAASPRLCPSSSPAATSCRSLTAWSSSWRPGTTPIF